MINHVVAYPPQPNCPTDPRLPAPAGLMHTATPSPYPNPNPNPGNYDITLDGLEPADLTLYQGPFDFGKYQLRLFADIDGMESGYADPLADYSMISVGNGSYMHSPQVTLFGDNICPNDVIEYNPWVLLPTFDEGMPGNDARDRIYSWDGPFTIEIEPVQIP